MAVTASGASVLFPYQGGTGTSTPPTFGDVLVGNANGTYDVVATSTLGITSNPAGSDTHVQFNDGGVFGGEADFTWNKTSNELKIGSLTGLLKGTTGVVSVAAPDTDYLTPITASSTYLKLDTSNDPLTGNLEIDKTDPEIRLTDETNEYVRLLRSSTSNTATLYNRVMIPGGTSPGLTFVAGDSDWATVPYAAGMRPALPITLSFWVKPTSGWPNFIFSNNYNSTKYYGVIASTNSSGKVYVHIGDGTGNTSASRRSKLGTTVLTAGQWWHVAVVYRGAGDITIYVNGSDDGGTYEGTGGAIAYTVTNTQVFGRAQQGTTYSSQSLDNFVMYDRELTSGEISYIYNGGTGRMIDVSGTFPSSGTPIATNLVAAYEWDENTGTAFSDSSANNNDGTISASDIWGTGKVNTDGVMTESIGLQILDAISNQYDALVKVGNGDSLIRLLGSVLIPTDQMFWLGTNGESSLEYNSATGALEIFGSAAIDIGMGSEDITLNGNDIHILAGNDFHVESLIIAQAGISNTGSLTTDTFSVGTNGALLKVPATVALVVNEDSADYDFRVEGNGDANLIFGDAGNDRVGIGTSTPSTRFEVYSTATSTISLDSPLAGCLKMRDSDGVGFTYITANDGVLSANVTSCQ